jgi:Rps23 Pro-64 3,4-dihydroxylase Tpa1-like proline 4-hydroxylase
VLLYLNKDWQDHFGGQLLVKASVDETPVQIPPLFNRCVIMLTDDHTYHGYRRMSLPYGVTRKSIAAYGYRHIDVGYVTPHTTGWAPEQAGPAKRFLARYYDRAVRTKNRYFGSRTAGNR